MSSSSRFPAIAITGFVFLTVLAVGFVLGRSGGQTGWATPAWANLPAFDGAARGQSMSLATGVIEGGVEALYGLDHLTGDLFCWILNPRTGAVSNTFRISAGAALGVSGEPDYVLTTGLMDFSGGADGGARPAMSVAYVGDGNSGKVAGFVLMYNRGAIQRGNNDNSAGELRLISEMLTRDARAFRDQGK